MVDFSSIGRRVTTQIVNTGLQKVAGNLPGLMGLGQKKGADTSDFVKLNKGEVDTKMFQFPLDVTADPGLGNQGHYMMFYINEQLDAQLRFAGEPKSGQDTINEELQRREIPYTLKVAKLGNDANVKVQSVANLSSYQDTVSSGLSTGLGTTTSAYYNPNTITKEERSVKEGLQVISLKRKPTRRLDTAIALYMPNTLSTTYGARYVDTQISPLASGVVDIVNEYTASGGSIEEAARAGKKKITEDLERRVLLKGLQLIDALGVTGAREAFEIGSGEVITDRMELAFKNVNRRNFTYNFKMLPKNAREADEIRNIINMFKVNMLPEMKKGRQLSTMNFPNTFDIRYMYNGKDNDYIHRVSTCVLENMTVTYGGDRFKTFTPHNSEGAPVVETVINLSFKELELITRERAMEGY